MKKFLIIIYTLMSFIATSQNIFIKDYPSSENYRIPRVKQDFNGDFVLSGYKDVLSENAMRPYVIKVNSNGQKIDSALFFIGMPYDWYIHDVLIDSTFYYFIGFSGDWTGSRYGPNDSSMFLLKTDYNLNPLDTYYYPVVNNQDIGYATSKFDFNGNIVTAGYYYTQNLNFGSFIKKIAKNGQSISSNIVPLDSNRWFTNLLIDSNYYYAFGYIWSNTLPRLLYKYDSSLNLIDTYVIPNKAQQYYSPLKNARNNYFTSGYVNSSTFPSTRKYAMIKSTIEGVLLDSIEFGITDSTNWPATYDALCMQNGYLYFAGSMQSNNSVMPPYGDGKLTSKLYIAKVDTSLNIIWEKLIGGDAYYTAMNVIGTSDGGILMLASRNDLNDNLNKLDVRLVKLDSNGNVTWVKNIEAPKTKINIYPNPTTTQIILDLGSKNQIIETLNIFTITGQKAVGLTNLNSSNTIDIKSLKSGVYLLEGVLESGESFVGKFVKE